ncbi:hypothetical protein [Phycicoccus avicenniae]|uniref:hypothetical protein n=1 Tax=Phycicoccus avicenniae TaxID=2828860 RepID=UPI003D28E364
MTVRDCAPETFIACVVRGTKETGWTVLDDGGHAPYGVAGVDVLADRVRVRYSCPQAQLAAVQATADETYARAGIAVGVSGALTHADLFFGRSCAPLAPAAALLPGSNVWLTGTGWTTPLEPAITELPKEARA